MQQKNPLDVTRGTRLALLAAAIGLAGATSVSAYYWCCSIGGQQIHISEADFDPLYDGEWALNSSCATCPCGGGNPNQSPPLDNVGPCMHLKVATGAINTRRVVATSYAQGQPELSIELRYSSFDTNKDTAISPGWTHNYDIRAISDGQGSWYFHSGVWRGQSLDPHYDPNYQIWPGKYIPHVILHDPNDPNSTPMEFTLPSGETYRFLSNGYVSRIIDAQGRVTTFTYRPGDGRLGTVTGQSGRSISFEYGVDPNDIHGLTRLIEITAAGGQEVDLDYDENGNLCAIIDGGGTTYYGYAEVSWPNEDMLYLLDTETLRNGVQYHAL